MAKKQILIIDDDPSFTALVRLTLEETGRYEVKEVNDERSALTAVSKSRPDLILLDVQMPNMFGQVLAQLIHSTKESKNTPIVFITGAITQQEIEEEGGRIQGYPYIAKPVKPDALIAYVDEHIGGSDPAHAEANT